MRNTREVPLPAGTASGIEGASTSSNVVIPFACEIIGIAWRTSVVLDADHTMDITLNGSDSGADLQMPDTEQQGIAYLSEKLFPAEGDLFAMTSNSEQTAATNAFFTLIIVPL